VSDIAKILNEQLPKYNILIFGYGLVARSFVNVLEQNLTTKVDVFIFDSSLPIHFENFKNLRIKAQQVYITEDNFKLILREHLSHSTICVNFSTTISSLDMALYCLDNGAIYLDTANNSWNIEKLKKNPSQEEYGERIKKIKKVYSFAGDGCAILNFGMNPGLVSFIAKSLFDKIIPSAETTDSAKIYFTEIDSQLLKMDGGSFGNTWSLEAMVEEFLLPSENIIKGSVKTDCLAIDSLRNFKTPFQSFKGYVVPHREVFSIFEWIKEQYSDLDVEEIAFIYSPNASAINFVKENIDDLQHGKFEKFRQTFQLNRELIPSDGYNEIGVYLETKEQAAFASVALSSGAGVCKKYKSNPTALLVAGSALIGLLIALDKDLKGVFEAEDLFVWQSNIHKLLFSLFNEEIKYQYSKNF
jgi:homospermidine synthase